MSAETSNSKLAESTGESKLKQLPRKAGDMPEEPTAVAPVEDQPGRTRPPVVGTDSIHSQNPLKTFSAGLEKKPAEGPQSLRESEERLRRVSDNANVGLTRLNRDWIYLSANPAYAEIAGKPLDQIIGRPMVEVLGDLGVETIRPYVERVLAGEHVTYEVQVPFVGAGRRYLHVSYTPDTDAAGRIVGWVASVTDITERKRSEDALRESQTRAELLSRLISDLLASNNPQAVVEEACNAVRNHLHCAVFFNYLLDEGTRRLRLNACGGVDPHVARLVENVELSESLCGTAMRDSCRVLAENLRITFDERSKLVRSMGVRAYVCHPLLGPGKKAFGTLSFGADDRDVFDEKDLVLIKTVTDHVALAMLRDRERKGLQRLYAALEHREANLRAILESTVDGIITINHQGIIRTVNPATERLFGYTASELIGRKVSILMPPPYHDEHDNYVANYLHTGIKKVLRIGREVVARRKDGSVFPADLMVNEIAQLKLFTGIIRDISKRKELEREILEIASLEQRRISQDLHDTVAQELTVIDFRTAELAEAMQAKLSPSDAKLVGHITEGIRRCNQELRAVMRGLCPVAVDSEGLMAALSDLADRTRQDRKIACTFDCPEPVAIVDVLTATHLYLIAQEAVHNAIKHAQPRNIRIHLESKLLLKISVEDDGAGIPLAATVLRQGEEQGARGAENLGGLGIRIMHNRAAIIGATLIIEQVQPNGTRVVCTLPRLNHDKEYGVTEDSNPDRR